MYEKDVLLQDLDNLEQYFSKLDIPIALCHNDLHIQNLIYNDKTG